MKNELAQISLLISHHAPTDGGVGPRRSPTDGGVGPRRLI